MLGLGAFLWRTNIWPLPCFSTWLPPANHTNTQLLLMGRMLRLQLSPSKHGNALNTPKHTTPKRCTHKINTAPTASFFNKFLFLSFCLDVNNDKLIFSSE